MTTLSCIIVDDEPLAIRLLQAHVAQVPELELKGSFEGAVVALTFLRQHPVDLVFLDIQMPAITGLEFARSIDPATQVVFTTAYRNYAVESYELRVLDYLLKPITFARFYQAVNKLLLRQSGIAPARLRPALSRGAAPAVEEKTYRYFNVNKKYIRLALENITHVESLKDYLQIHTADQSIMTRGKISAFEEDLPDYFLRTHRSFLVNLRHVTAYTAHDLEVGTVEIPIGASYKINVLKQLR